MTHIRIISYRGTHEYDSNIDLADHDLMTYQVKSNLFDLGLCNVDDIIVSYWSNEIGEWNTLPGFEEKICLS